MNPQTGMSPQKKSEARKVMLAFDVDGTLVDSQGVVYPSMSAIIEEFSEAVDFMILTGRPRYGLTSILSELSVDCPLVCLNGAVGYQSIDTPEVFAHFIDSELVQSLLFRLRSLNGAIKSVLTYGGSTWHAWGDRRSIKEEERLTKSTAQTHRVLESLAEHSLLKITLVCESDLDATRITKQFGSIYPTSLEIQTSRPHYVEITSTGVDKATGFKKLCSAIGGQPFTIAVGDGENDIPLFRIADYSFATHDSNIMVKSNARSTFSKLNPNAIRREVNRLLNDVS